MEQYFAAKSGPELLRILNDRKDELRTGWDDSGQWDDWQQAYDKYYGDYFKKASRIDGSKLVRMGDNNHLIGFAVNHFRNLIKHLLVMTTAEKPSFDCMAQNSDLKSMQQARLGNNILEAYLTEKRLSRYMYMAAEQALVFKRGHVAVEWEPSLGKPYTRDAVRDEQGQPVLGEDGKPLTKVIYEGDAEVSNPYPWQVFCDEVETDWNKIKWVEVVQLKNKYDLASRYPHLEERILAIPPISEDDTQRWYKIGHRFISKETSSSLIEVTKFYHLKTDYMPNGRFMIGAGEDVIMYDDAIPYDKLPVFRIVPGEKIGTTEGYTDAHDLMGPQDAYNVIMSTIFTNLQALGINIIAVPEGANLTKEMISKGLAFIKCPPGGEPKAINLAQLPDVLFKALEVIEKVMETTSGVNSVARGNPDYDMSGVAMSLLQSMTAQYSSGFQQSWGELYEDVGTFILNLLQNFAHTKRLVAMAGKYNRNAMASFTGEDLKGIKRVSVKLGNPISRTVAGKLHMADTLMDKGQIQTPQEYIQVMNTGNLEPIIKGPQSQVDRIAAENEALMDGKPVRALVSDPHLLDIQEHTSVINDPVVRQKAAEGDPYAQKVVANTLAHIQEHMMLYKTQDPLWSQVAGEPPNPQPPMLPAPPPGAPLPPGPGAPVPEGAPMPAPEGGAPGPIPPMPGAPAPM